MSFFARTLNTFRYIKNNKSFILNLYSLGEGGFEMSMKGF